MIHFLIGDEASMEDGPTASLSLCERGAASPDPTLASLPLPSSTSSLSGRFAGSAHAQGGPCRRPAAANPGQLLLHHPAAALTSPPRELEVRSAARPAPAFLATLITLSLSLPMQIWPRIPIAIAMNFYIASASLKTWGKIF